MGAVYKKLSETMHHVQGRFILSGTFEADLDTPGYVARNAATVKHKGKREEKNRTKHMIKRYRDRKREKRRKVFI